MNSNTIQIELNEPNPPPSPVVAMSPPARRSRTDSVKAHLPSAAERFTDSACHYKRTFDMLATAPVFREYQRAFEHATGLPLSLRSVASWTLAHNGNRNQSRFCALMSETSRSCAACLQMQQSVCEGVNGNPCTKSCSFGLTESAVAVKAGRRIIGFLQTGQVFFNPPTQEQTNRALKQIKAWDLNLDIHEAARAYGETPVVNRGGYEATVRLLQFFADQLGGMANQTILVQKNAEPAQITRARRFIVAHHHEELTLPVVARQAGMSVFYFCKSFKKATGLTYTDYLSRVRVERAKNLLLNRSHRVTEVAFEVGFQSLTHFNRVFRRIAGQSPTGFRSQAQLSCKAAVR